MKKSSRVLLGLVCCISLSCSNTKPSAVPNDSWRGLTLSLCAEDLPKIIESLAGPDAIDCGTSLHVWSDENISNKSAKRCAIRSSKDDRTIVFGAALRGADSGTCDIVLRSSDRSVLHLTYDYHFEILDQPSHALKRKLQVERCGNVIFAEDSTAYRSYYRLENCVEDAEELNRVLKMHNSDT